MKKFSVLIAHYNNYSYFLDCYESIRKQMTQNIEIIIVDDHSNDGSYEKITDFLSNENDVKIYRNTENKGVGYTKRKCVELASGEICGFIDPDDAIAENAIEKMLQHYNSDKIVAVYSQFMLCDANLQASKIFPGSQQVKNQNPLFFNIFYELNHFFTFRKSAYDNTDGINPDLTSAVDQDLYLKIYEQGDMIFIKNPLYFYRLHEKGVSQEKSKKEKLNKNWQKVLSDTLKRRNIGVLYGKKISEIENLPTYIYEKQNTWLTRLSRKLK